ncbi:hypothetical protein GGR92_002534 [Spirosoma lacussanchae]|uniref:GAF domain-containing protein n=1 Tax=Spirosoma lacussanchae TaxID=1884249 RepID=UPI001108400D|nr:GAF domain-containing protein [Spirosoma lacussanchae]
METLIEEPIRREQLLRYQLSFRPFLRYLNAQRQAAGSGSMARLYTYLIEQFEPVAALTSQSLDALPAATLSNYFQLATTAVLPLADSSQSIPYAFGLPMPLRLFHHSPALERLISQFPQLLVTPPVHDDPASKQRFLYRLILEKCYDVSMPYSPGLSFGFQQEVSGLTKYYQLDVNVSFIEPYATGELPPLQPAWIEFARGSAPLPAQVEPLPLEQFTFEGFSFFRVEDVTEAESIQQLRDVFVHLTSATEPESYTHFETALRNLCGQPGLEIGLLPLPKVNGKPVVLPDNHERSVFLRFSGLRMDDCDELMTQTMVSELSGNPCPHLVTDLTALPKPAYQLLVSKGFRSFLLYPIVVGGEMLGVLEMGSRQPNAFDETILGHIERVLPLIQELIRYQLQQFQDRLETYIRTKFTSLQPAVEWKFYETAWAEMSQPSTDPAHTSPLPIRFPQVYPFYGAVDIRNSSNERQKAIRQDLLNQLSLIEEILYQVRQPAVGDRHNNLMLSSYQWQTHLTNGLTPDQEQSITLFFQDEVAPYLQRLQTEQSALTAAISQYFAQIDPKTGFVNQALSAYEQTMDRLNTVVNNYINQEEKELQALFPHYFERYRTDGTEYSIYAGQSIAPGTSFPETVRQQLYQWQLKSMVDMARLTYQLRPELPLPLQTTQLILAHTQAVDISFRRDERRFDVEGSYSIRYEVLKKRIDKVNIRNTNERLTQPDTIALVYTYSDEITEYLPFIAELQRQGKLKPGLDYVDLEPVQGVATLKALRVTIQYPD